MFKIKHFSNIESIKNIDLFIGASGFESRAIFQAEKLNSVINHGVVIGFDHYKDSSIRLRNDREYENLGFELILANEDESENISLAKVVYSIGKVIQEVANPVIFLDYSSMSRNWYSYIIYVLFNSERRKEITLLMGYSHAEHVDEQQDQSLNRIVEPLHGYCNFGIPNKPTSLVIGLGNEPNKVFGLKEYFDAIPFIFHTDKSYNSKYFNEAKAILTNVLTQVPETNVYEFPIADMEYTYFLLDNLCTQLVKDTRVILAPCGPKPFTLLCLLLSLRYEDSLEVWRISGGKDAIPINREPTGKTTVLKLKFIE